MSMVTYVLSRRQVVWADSFRLVGAAWQLSAVRPPDAAFLIELERRGGGVIKGECDEQSQCSRSRGGRSLCA
jgi:hypothetical protein